MEQITLKKSLSEDEALSGEHSPSGSKKSFITRDSHYIQHDGSPEDKNLQIPRKRGSLAPRNL